MEIKLSPEVRREMSDTLREYGYKSELDLIEDALKRRILELKKADFLSKIKDIIKSMSKTRLREEDILKDFDKFYHRNRK